MRGTLTRKLFIYFFVVIVLSLISVSAFSYKKSSKELDMLVTNQMTQMVSNAVHQTDLFLQAYERSIVSILTNQEIRRLIELPADADPYMFYDYRQKIKNDSINSIFIRNPEVVAVYALSENEHATYFYNQVEGKPFGRDVIRETNQFFREHTTEDGKLNIVNYSVLDRSREKDQILTLVRQVRGYVKAVTKGYLAIEIRADELSALWNGFDLGEKGYFFIVDDQGLIVYHPDRSKAGQYVSTELNEQIHHGDANSFEQKDGDEWRMFSAKRSNFTGWNLVVSMPLDELRKPVSSIRSTTLIVGLFTLAVALLVAYRFGRSITDPIRVLKNGMRETEMGRWATLPVPDRKDEITELMIRYNLMVNRLSELIDQVYQAELDNQEMQLERHKAVIQSLQLQINPHFLYNTLETIVCYAFIQNSKEISEIVKELSHMLRYSVQTNLEETKVANELKHVMHFLVILRYRLNREFELDVAIRPEYLLHDMVRLTLQPLVENVFQHAFPDGIEDYHVVRIDAGEDEGVFWVSVEDNGVGMTPERLAELRQKLDANRLADESDGKKGGIGILNVHRRIQMVFGEEYGLVLESEPDRGTKMIMRMPASKNSPKGRLPISNEKRG